MSNFPLKISMISVMRIKFVVIGPRGWITSYQLLVLYLIWGIYGGISFFSLILINIFQCCLWLESFKIVVYYCLEPSIFQVPILLPNKWWWIILFLLHYFNVNCRYTCRVNGTRIRPVSKRRVHFRMESCPIV